MNPLENIVVDVGYEGNNISLYKNKRLQRRGWIPFLKAQAMRKVRLPHRQLNKTGLLYQ